MATQIWDNIGSGNGSLPDGTEPLPEPKLTYQLGLVAFTIYRKWSRYLSLKWIWKITNLELQPHLPGANELTLLGQWSVVSQPTVAGQEPLLSCSQLWTKFEPAESSPLHRGEAMFISLIDF